MRVSTDVALTELLFTFVSNGVRVSAHYFTLYDILKTPYAHLALHLALQSFLILLVCQSTPLTCYVAISIPLPESSGHTRTTFGISAITTHCYDVS
ncbi:hypothetical protein EDB89DRAFT_1939712 [Lactarius sanguifluus]|nr:hypothetical protein EDB89DRAFT_1939712 [Lactarius sanguifluus]